MKRHGMARSMTNSLAGHSRPLIERVERRLFMKQSLSLGALALLSGCELTNDESVQKVLTTISQWNDGVQAWIFDPKKAGAGIPRIGDHHAVSVQRLL